MPDNSGQGGVETCDAAGCSEAFGDRHAVASAEHGLTCCSWACLSTAIETREAADG